MSWWRRPRESTVEEYAVKRGQEEGGRLEKLPPTAGEKHRPDRVFAHPARPAAYLELKRPGEEPTPEQEFSLRMLRALGFVAEWAASREQVDAFYEKVRHPPMAMAIAIWQEATREAKKARGAVGPGARRRPGGRAGARAGGSGADQ